MVACCLHNYNAVAILLVLASICISITPSALLSEAVPWSISQFIQQAV